MTTLESDWLKRWNLYSPEKTAIKDGLTGQSFTYRQCYEFSLALAHVLKSERGVGHGDRVVVLAGNSLEYILLFFALQRLGAIMVPINFRLTKREIQHILEDSKPRLIFYSAELTKNAEELDFEAVALMKFGEGLFAKAAAIASNLTSPLTSATNSTSAAEATYTPVTSGPEVSESFGVISFAAAPEDIAMILYTSGTTGAPKGAMLSHRMIFWNSVNTGLRLNLSQADKTVIFLPLFHTGGWNVLTTPFLHRGAEIILLPKFDAELVLKLSAEEKATILFGVPTTMGMMAQSPQFVECDISSLRYAIVGGEAMPRALIETWHKKGVPVRQGYGLTEFGPNVFSLNEEDAIRKIGSIGFPNFYIDAKVVDDKGEEVTPGEIGELILSGPSIMSGYWQNQEATTGTIKDEWLYTGDFVLQDEEGYFYVAGRKKEMYISGGENVYPAEIEQVLHNLPEIKEVAVVGVSDPQWGEVGKAFLSFKNPDQVLSQEELENHCRKNLAKFKVPKAFQVLPELPKGDSGKILKRRLLEL